MKKPTNSSPALPQEQLPIELRDDFRVVECWWCGGEAALHDCLESYEGGVAICLDCLEADHPYFLDDMVRSTKRRYWV